MCTRTILLILGLTISIQGTLEPQIVGGHNAEAGKYPYQAFIMKQSSFLCGGSIITENMILTAAHCIHRENAYNFGVVVGTYNLSLTNPAVKYSAQKLIWHPDFDPVTTLRNDIGLIWLTENINFTKNIQPIRLASVSDVGAGKKAVVTGWGKLSQVGPIAYTLQEIELNIISQLQCQRFWNVKDSQICTLTKRSEGVCNGDSGGPLVINGEQVGIVSYGKLCAQGYPDVYTKVYNYKKWIAKYTKEAGSSIEIDTNAASTVTQAWISTLLAIFTYLHFLVL